MSNAYRGNIKVRFADTDANGHAFFGNYFVFADEVLGEYWQELGLDVADVVNPDFLMLANAYGFAAERVTLTVDFGPALRRALDASGSTLIELVTDAQAIAHTMTLSEIRARAKS